MGKMKQFIVSAVVFCGLGLSGQVLASKLADQSGNDEPIGTRSLLSPTKIAERTKPDAVVCVQGEDCASASPVVAAAEEESKSPEDIYNASCAACHGTGALDAPKLGDTSAWSARIEQGTDALYEHAIDGFNSMPAKGGCATCSDDDIKAIVDYMVEQAQ